MALHDPDADLRKTRRFALNLPASLRERERPRSPVRVVDISTHGCRLELPYPLAVGSWVWLKLAALETQYARIAWSRDLFAGLEFARPLNEAVLNQLISRSTRLTERDAARLREISARCEQLAQARDTQAEAAPLQALARDCMTGTVVRELVTRFS